MGETDLLRLMRHAIREHLSPELPLAILETLAADAGAEAAVLVNAAGDPPVVWPPELQLREDPARPLWEPVDLGRDDTQWAVFLRGGRPPRAELAAGAAVVLHMLEMRAELRRSRFDERSRLWELEAVRAIAESVGGILEPSRIAEEVIAHLIGLLGVRRAQIVLGSEPEEASTVAAFGERVLPVPVDAATWAAGRREDGVLAAPLTVRGQHLGILAVAEKEARTGTEPFTAGDARVVELFAAQVAVALENARLSRESIEQARLRQEMDLAAAVQAHLYPESFPEVAGWRVRARYFPMREVAGDSFDVVQRNSGLLAAVTDVSGKGVSAGMLAAGLHALTRMLAEEGVPVITLAERLNRYLAGVTADNRFATMVAVELGADGAFHAVHAGHCPSLIRRADGRVEELPSNGLPLGILPQARYTDTGGILAPGELLILYTDGITEAEDASGEELGVERFKAMVAGVGGGGADAACSEILEQVSRYSGGSPTDDVTLVVVERETAE